VSARQAVRTFFTVAKDVVSYALGWWLMDSQAGMFTDPPAHPNETLMWIAALLIGVPGVAQVIALRFGGTGSMPPPSAAQPSSVSPSPSSAGPSSGADA
jgi:hypothetical protein